VTVQPTDVHSLAQRQAQGHARRFLAPIRSLMMRGSAREYALWFLTSHLATPKLCRGPRHVRLRARRTFRRSDDMPCSMHMWKTLGAPRDTRQMCSIQAHKHYPCPRVGYPALGAGHARNQGGSVHQFSTNIAPYATSCRSSIRRCH